MANRETEVRMTATRTESVMAAIRRRMASRTLTTGEKLPSIRSFARDMQVSPSTVVEAYDRLAAEGLIRSRPGSGFYVAGSLPPVALAEVEPKLDRAIDPFWVSRQSLDAGPEMLRPGCGWLPSDWMPNAAIRRAIRALARADDAVLADYGGTRGSLALRRLLVRQFAAEGIEAGADQILLTMSGTQAIDLVCRFLLNPGDTVLVDDPCYFNFQALLRAHRVKIVSVPYTPTGPDIALFNEALAAHRPRLYVTNAALHNPTGATLAPQTAHRILTAAAAHDLTIVEDEIFADFEPEPSPRLASLDGLSRVIRDRQLLQDALGLDTLRLHRRPAGLDRGPRRSAGGDELRRAEPGRGRARVRDAARRQLPQAPDRACAAASRGGAGRSSASSKGSASAPGRCRAAVSISGAACLTDGTRPRSREPRCASGSCSPQATSSASRSRPPISCASTWRR